MTEIGHVAFQSMRLDETNTMKPSLNVLSLFNQNLLTKETVFILQWPLIIFQEAIG